MNSLEDVLRSPPNGLHDAELTAIAVDDARAEVIASVVVVTERLHPNRRPPVRLTWT